MSSILYDNIKELPPMPQIAKMVLDLLEDPDFSFAELVRIISKDANITVAILKLANSAFYSPKNKIVNLTQAMSFLGVKAIKNLVISLSTKSLFLKGRVGVIEQKLWEHSVGTAIMSRLLMLRVDKKLVEEAFLLGLIHDIGVSVMKMNLENYELILQDAFNENIDLCALENERLGINHAQVGAELMKFWKMPEIYSDVVLNHHSPENSASKSLANVLFLSNNLLKCFGIGIGSCNEEFSKYIEAIGLDEAVFEDIKGMFKEVYDAEKEIFNI